MNFPQEEQVKTHLELPTGSKDMAGQLSDQAHFSPKWAIPQEEPYVCAMSKRLPAPDRRIV